MSESVEITKSDGHHETFSEHKLLRSLRRAGASHDQAEWVLKTLEPQIQSGISSQQLQRQAFKQLKQLRKSVAARYQLKQAIVELGPSGYPFERLIGEIFRKQGYEIQVGQILKGHCVNHEVDVVARKPDEVVLVECKYRNLPGFKCDVKVPLYIRSRFEDIRSRLPDDKARLSGWIATNARFSGDAIKYAECVGLKLLSWDYPYEGGLRQYIDQNRLYPLTILTSLSKPQKNALLAQQLILCKDLLKHPEKLARAGIAPELATLVLQECEALLLDSVS